MMVLYELSDTDDAYRGADAELALDDVVLAETWDQQLLDFLDKGEQVINIEEGNLGPVQFKNNLSR